MFKNEQKSSTHRACNDPSDVVKTNPIKVHQVIDLTDKPIRLEPERTCYSRVRTNASNCICCCYDNSITLVTTDESYILNHIPLDNICDAQVSHNLQNLALCNESSLAIIELVSQGDRIENYRKEDDANNNSNSNGFRCSKNIVQQVSRQSGTRFVNLAAFGLSMSDVIFWRWLDESTLAILTHECLFTCSLDQPHINHPAMSALLKKSQLLSISKVCDIDEKLTSHQSQVVDIQRDSSANLFAVVSMRSEPNGGHDSIYGPVSKSERSRNISVPSPLASVIAASSAGSSLRSGFGSVPSKLSQLVNNSYSFDSLRSESLFDSWKRGQQISSKHNFSSSSSLMVRAGPQERGPAHGLAQIHCKWRDCSQLITAHAAAFTSSLKEPSRTILVTAARLDLKLRVHFVPMVSSEHPLASAGHSSPSIDFGAPDDYPKFITFSQFGAPKAAAQSAAPNQATTIQLALVCTKFGQLVICDAINETILLVSRVTSNCICSAVGEHRSGGLMLVCANGQVLVVQLDKSRLGELCAESKRNMRQTPSCPSSLSELGAVQTRARRRNNSHSGTTAASTALEANDDDKDQDQDQDQDEDDEDDYEQLDIDFEILISTKL